MKSPVQKSLYGSYVVCRAVPDTAKADVLWEGTGMCTRGTAGVEVQASEERFAEITLGRSTSQQGLATTCTDPLTEGDRGRWEGRGPAPEPVGAVKEG